MTRSTRVAGAVVALTALTLSACGGGTRARGTSPATTSPATATTSPATTSSGPAAGTERPGGDAVVSGFVAFGDFGGGEAQGSVAAAMERWAAGHRADALVTTGDNVYTVGDPRLFDAQLDKPYAALRRSRPMWATLGNHDVASGHGAEQLAHLGLPPLPYAKELPGVQLLFLDANHPDEAQARWLDQRLSEGGPAFRVVVFHQPAYSCGLHGSTALVDRLWVPVIERHRVALVLNGHDHDYERFISEAAVTYVVTGGGGQSLYPLLSGCMSAPTEEAGARRHHFVGVEVQPHALTLTAVADDGTVLDHAVIAR